MALAILATHLAEESVNAFFGDDRYHHESSHRIGPPLPSIQKAPLPAKPMIAANTAKVVVSHCPAHEVLRANKPNTPLAAETVIPRRTSDSHMAFPVTVEWTPRPAPTPRSR